jgi:hypothetical protein
LRISSWSVERRSSPRPRRLAQRGVAEGRDLTVEEQTAFDEQIGEAGKLHERAKAIHDGEERAHDLENSFRKVTGREPESRDPRRQRLRQVGA